MVMVLVLSAATLLILASTLGWTSTNVTLTARNNEYFRTLAAAEAATEKVIAAIEWDYQAGGDATVLASLDNYRALVPLASESPGFGNYTFSDAQNNNGKTYLDPVGPADFRVLAAEYRNLSGWSAIYRVISNARDNTSRYKLNTAVWQDIETATIPIFQFAIFYNPDLEINPGANMTVTGPVHANQIIYVDPGATLTFQGDVTTAKNIINEQKPGDPMTNRSGTIDWGGNRHVGGQSSLNMPIGLDNSPSNVHKVVEPPLPSEDPNSPLGKQRFYNKADIIITVTDTNTSVTSGIVNNKGTAITNLSTISTNQRWLDTSRTLWNAREVKTVKQIEIDVAKLSNWNASANNTLPVRPVTGGTKDVTIIYVDDQRTLTGSQESGVLVKNGSFLPSTYGLTIATPEPIYVAGDYNTKDATGTSSGSDTSHTRPAALIGDAITILSKAWDTSDPNYGNKPFTSRAAQSTTVNAAFLAGVVETTTGQYSGGVENYPRFLEDWSPSSGAQTFTYNGSMVVMYPSQYATGLWRGTGSTFGIYDPPVRVWAFDQNFKNVNKLPPGTPCVRAVIRGAWASIRPNTTTINDPDALVP